MIRARSGGTINWEAVSRPVAQYPSCLVGACSAASWVTKLFGGFRPWRNRRACESSFSELFEAIAIGLMRLSVCRRKGECPSTPLSQLCRRNKELCDLLDAESFLDRRLGGIAGLFDQFVGKALAARHFLTRLASLGDCSRLVAG